jgi:hypothetical protein
MDRGEADQSGPDGAPQQPAAGDLVQQIEAARAGLHTVSLVADGLLRCVSFVLTSMATGRYQDVNGEFGRLVADVNAFASAATQACVALQVRMNEPVDLVFCIDRRRRALEQVIDPSSN